MSTEIFDNIFGPESVGGTAEERAATSRRLFVRSQLQLAEDRPEATGHRLTASEALSIFGWDILKQLDEYGSCPLIQKRGEPADTLRIRRSDLNLTEVQVARQVGLDPSAVLKAEIPGELSPFRVLQRIGQALALDERLLGYIPGAHGDGKLGVRLREMARNVDARKFSPFHVLGLAEAAWVIARQYELAEVCGLQEGAARSFAPSKDYSYKAYEKGYILAQITRERLSIPPEEPISSLKVLIEDRLGTPVVQQSLGDKFAGATIANGSRRGIVVNEIGANANVWVRRMTMAHEVGHLLWDPDERLDNLRADNYIDLNGGHHSYGNDVVEIRANAFAVAFLAPAVGVRKIMDGASDKTTGVGNVMTHYGISATAAVHHIKNTIGIDVSDLSRSKLPQPSDDWKGRENLAIDIFRPEETPISRRGQFAWLVARAFQMRKISADSAALDLRCGRYEFERDFQFILDALTPSDARANLTG